MAIITLENINYTYGAKTPFEKKALNKVSISINAGNVTGIIGHTGSGKSTLVQILAGLLKPDDGKYIFDDKDVWENPKKPQHVKFKVGLVMQYPEYQLFDETVRDDISFGPKNMKLSADEINERVTESALYTGIGNDVLDKSPFDLSGGQKRRAAIAGVIAMRPKVLVLDEPAAGLDPKGRAEILGGLRSYRDSVGATVIIVSHSMEDIARYCDDIIVMDHGCVTLHGKADEVFSSPQILENSGLNIPSVTNICRKLKEAGMPIDSTVLTPEQAAELIYKALEQKRRDSHA